MITRYGILLPGRVLAHDHAQDRPATYAHKQSAGRAMLRSVPDYLATSARVVRVTYHPTSPNGKPTYEVHL